MKLLKPEIDIDRFYSSVREAERSVLFLDYDGTLAPFTVARDEAVPYPGVRELIDEIIDSGKTRVVIISGRWTRDLIPLLNLTRKPEIWGSHGLERLKSDGTYYVFGIEEKMIKGLADAEDLLDALGLGYQRERKPGSVAVHWRGLDEDQIEEIKKKVELAWSPIAAESGLHLKDFDGGLELRAPDRNKGDAVRTILAEERGDIAAAYLGDDLTDEDAFNALNRMGLRVLVRPEFRPTAADLWITPPGELIDFLERWLENSRGM